MSALSDAIGMNLQLDRIEVPVGPYFADILAKDASGEYVVIENQFGKTNHDHLGKLLTYGATFGVSAVVWIAEQFTEEHRKTVEWLNERTIDSLSLYAVQLEVLQVDDSAPAIRFNVISQPNPVVRAATAAKSSGSLTELSKCSWSFDNFPGSLAGKRLSHQLRLHARNTGLTWRSADQIYFSNILDTYASRIGVRVYIGNRIAEAALAQLALTKLQLKKRSARNWFGIRLLRSATKSLGCSEK